MKLCKTLTFVLLLSTQFTVNAKELQQAPDPTKGNVGFGLSAVIGAASGIWFGVRESDADTPITMLEKKLNAESTAVARHGDKEAYIFDRRVTINLTLDTEA